MEWREMTIDAYGRILQTLERSLKGLTRDDLDQMPNPECNSMGWLTWHLTRIQDDHIAGLMKEEQLWVRDGWHAKFNREADPKDLGFGHTPEDVAAFKSPDAETMLAYHRAVLERSQAYIGTLSPADLDRELDEPWFQPLPTAGVRLVSIISDNIQHAGQVAYVRGLLKGRGWAKF